MIEEEEYSIVVGEKEEIIQSEEYEITVPKEEKEVAN